MVLPTPTWVSGWHRQEEGPSPDVPGSDPLAQLPPPSAIVLILFGGTEEGSAFPRGRQAGIGEASLGQGMISFADSCLQWM